MMIPYDTRSIFLGRSTTPPPALAEHRRYIRTIRRSQLAWRQRWAERRAA